MKNLLFILLFLTMVGEVIAKNKLLKEPFIGSWKYSKQTAINDFSKVIDSRQQNDSQTEFFNFETDHSFIHKFYNKDGVLIKKLTGKWKSTGDKIQIEYADIDFNISISYFFLDKDLVLGQNFNHVIFTKDVLDNQNFAAK